MQQTGHFYTTRWTQVVRAKESSHEGREALRDLCDIYYAPVMAYLRRELRDPDAAQELAHEFFAYMLRGEAIRTAEQMRGRFRSYLLGAVKHFLLRQHELEQRLKRGSGVKPVSMDDDAAQSLRDEDQLTPDAAFDRQWALTVLERALKSLKQECDKEERGALFEKLTPWLTGNSDHGDQAALAQSLGMNLNSLKSAVHRLKQSFRMKVREEVASTLEDGADVEEEMRVLFAALRSR
ncbi:sigma factor [Prosthecobacter algae]|uniref:Sigma factor n=2 Tax=Prosthecobacter algae TaxID=1144682 RepID=A0ABP9P2C9_9BACT